MRIVSNFHDYYDTVQAHGSDPNLIYRRTTSEADLKADDFPFAETLEFVKSLPRANLIHPSVVAFCGTLVPIWCAGSVWSQDPATMREFLVRKAKEGDVLGKNALETFDRDRPRIWQREFSSLCIRAKTVESAIERGKAVTPEVDLFIRFSSPILLITPNGNVWRSPQLRVVVNPKLEDLGFYRWVDAFTAFQEISMYLGNQLSQPDIAPQTVGGDKVIAASKGFDEWSFRTMAPGTKKENRKANRAKKQKL